MSNYNDFLAQKTRVHTECGFDVSELPDFEITTAYPDGENA